MSLADDIPAPTINSDAEAPQVDDTPAPTIDSDSEAPPVKTLEETAPVADGSNRYRIWIWRTLFVLVTAASTAWFTGHLVSRADRRILTLRFDERADMTKSSVENFLKDVGEATFNVAVTAGKKFPNATDWPNVWIDDFSETGRAWGLRTTSDVGFFFAPLVTPEQADDFEEFAVKQYSGDLYQKPYIWTIPKLEDGETWDQQSTFDNVQERYPEEDGFPLPRDVFGKSQYGSLNEGMMAPILQVSPDLENYKLMNLHGSLETMRAIDTVLECTKRNVNETERWRRDCRTLSTMEPIPLTDNNSWREGSWMIMVPVYPDNDPLTPVGFAVGVVGWGTILERMEWMAYGFDVVIGTANATWSWGDPKDERYEKAVTYSLCGGKNYYWPGKGWPSCAEDSEEIGKWSLKAKSDVPYIYHDRFYGRRGISFNSGYFVEYAAGGQGADLYPGRYWIERNDSPQRALWSGLIVAAIVVVTSILYFVVSDRCDGRTKK